VHKRRLFELLQQIIEERLDIRWTCLTRANLVEPSLLCLMKNAGCIGINYGVEHGDNNSLAMLKKGMDLEQINRALSWTAEAGIPYSTNYILGFPWETQETIRRTVRHAIEFYGNEMNYSPVVPYPGTEEYESNKDKHGIVNWWLKRDGLSWEEIYQIGRSVKFGEIAFFRLAAANESFIERASVVFYRQRDWLLDRQSRDKLFSAKAWVHLLLYRSLSLSAGCFIVISTMVRLVFNTLEKVYWLKGKVRGRVRLWVHRLKNRLMRTRA
jgi:radical SAM superfamily enzyme YgiQ (UPF0313 family)